MEEEGVGLALAKATELRLKISNYVQKATAGKLSSRNEQSPQKQEGEQANNFGCFNGENLTEEEEEETERLLSIRDGLESLESQLVALQVCHLETLFNFFSPRFVNIVFLCYKLEALQKP